MTRERRDKPVGLRLTATTKEGAETAARQDNRTLASWVETLIIEELKRRGIPTGDVGHD